MPGSCVSAPMSEQAKEETYECEACGKSFDSQESLDRHLRRVGIVE